jgi:hypothetical protein
MSEFIDKPFNIATGVRLRDNGVLASEMVRQSITDGVPSHISHKVTASRLGYTYLRQDYAHTSRPREHCDFTSTD